VHPILFHLGGFPVSAYGTALSLAFAFGIALAYRRAPAAGLAREPVVDVSLWIIAAALIGARALYVVTHPADFRGHWLDAVNPFQGGRVQMAGMSLMGGLPAAIAAALLYLRARGLPLLAYADLLAPSVALGAALTRVGCLLNGCCFGKPTSLPIGVRYPTGSLPAQLYGDQPVHATPLYESAAALALCLLLLALARRKPFAGALFFLLMLGMGLERLGAELLRHPTEGAQAARAVALALAVAGVAGLAWRARRPEVAPA
jgi:phosphatidylglycerol:prolipoprotein diacylglycerol transferase